MEFEGDVDGSEENSNQGCVMTLLCFDVWISDVIFAGPSSHAVEFFRRVGWLHRLGAADHPHAVL